MNAEEGQPVTQETPVAAPPKAAPVAAATPTAPAKVGGKTPDFVPMHRFQSVTAQKENATADAAAARAERVAALAERDAAVAERDAAKTAAAAAAATAADLAAAREELGLVRAGVTEADDADVLRLHYGKIPADTRPATILDYVASLRADGATIPRSLAHVFGAKPTPVVTTTPAPVVPVVPDRKPMPKAPGEAGVLPPTEGVVTPEAMKQLRLDATRTGDHSALAAAIAAVEEARKKKP